MSTTPTITPELVAPEDQKELIAVIHQNNLQVETAQSLQASFAPLFGQARILIEKSRGIVVTDASQTLEIKTARIHRLALKVLRVSGEKLHRELKDEYVRGGRAIDGFKNIFIHLVEGEESRLEEQEKFVERQETKRKEALKQQRTEILVGINADPTLYSLGEMDESTFQQLVEGVKLARAAAESRRLKEEADRIAKEAADLAERERVRLENERLKREADEKAVAEKLDRERRQNLHAERRIIMQPFVASGDESMNGFYGDMTDEQFGEAKAGAENRRESRLKAEQEAAELAAKLAEERRLAQEAADRAAKEKAEAEAAAKQQREFLEAKAEQERRDAEAKLAEQKSLADERARKAKVEADKRAKILKEENDRIKAQLKAESDAQAKRVADEAARKAVSQSAPDRMKLMQLASDLRDIGFPACATREGQTVAARASADLESVILWIEKEAKKLGSPSQTDLPTA